MRGVGWPSSITAGTPFCFVLSATRSSRCLPSREGGWGVLTPLKMLPRQGGQGETLLSATLTPCGCYSKEGPGIAFGLDGTSLIVGLQRSPLHPAFRQNCTKELVWLNKQCKHVVVRSLLSVRPQEGSSVIESSRQEDELQSLCEAAQLDRALDLLWRMDQQGTVPPPSVYRSFLKACTKQKALAQAKRLYAHLVSHGLETTGCLGEDVVSTLVKCGDLDDAVQVFHRLAQRSVFSWTAIISGYTAARQGHEALRMYDRMLEEGVEPNNYTIVGLLKACRGIHNLNYGKRIHAEALKYGCEKDRFVGTCLVDMYAKCGSIGDAQNVFDRLAHRDVVSWTTMLTAYVQQGKAEKALELYVQMLGEGVSPDNRTFVVVLQACGMLGDKDGDDVANCQWTKVKLLEMGKSVHANAWGQGYGSDVFIGNTLVSMYGKCGSLGDAQQVFEVLWKRDVVPWNAMLAAYAQQGEAEKALELYEQMLEQGVSHNERTFVSLLQACAMLADEEDDVVVDGQRTKVKSLKIGKVLHANVSQNGYDADVFVGNTLVSMYSKSGSIMDAQMVFDELPERDVVSWNGMVAAHAQQDQPEEALDVFERMLEEGFSPSVRTFVSALHACGMLAESEEDVVVGGQSVKVQCLSKGKEIHADVWRKGYELDVFAGNILVSMYGKCGSIEDAQNLFEGLSARNLVAWTAMLSAHVQQGQGERAFQLSTQMLEEGLSPDNLTFLSMLQACALLAVAEKEVDVFNGIAIKLNSLNKGKVIHADAWKKGYKTDLFIGSALISMYAKCGSIADAENVFDGYPQRSVGAWNAMLSAYVAQGQGGKALQLYKQMEQEGVSRDEITLVCILQACSGAGSLGVCRQIYRSLVATTSNLSALLANTAIHAFGSCSSMVDAQSVFDALPQPDVVSWTTLIAGYAREGNYGASLQCFEQMQLAWIAPNAITFLALLSACTHAGLVNKGIQLFESMIGDHGITPEIEHYSSMVDLLGRAGHFTAVRHLLLTMPMQPDFALWVCLLGACQKHGKVELGREAFDIAVRLQPKHPAPYVLMSNIYSDAGFWDRAQEVKGLRQKTGAWKEPGQSWIEHCQVTHTFVVGDQQHPQLQQLYEMLAEMSLDDGAG